MKTDIVLAGVGGQGILTIAAVLGRATVNSGMHLKQAEVHGMAQRGGAVQSHFRMSETDIHSDVIPKGTADLLLSMEPMELLRYLPWLSESGWVVVNETPVENIPNYPPLETLHAEIDRLPRVLRFDGTQIARANGSPRSLNIAMLGAGAPFTGLKRDALENAIIEHFEPKGKKIVETNLKVFDAAWEVAQRKIGGQKHDEDCIGTPS